MHSRNTGYAQRSPRHQRRAKGDLDIELAGVKDAGTRPDDSLIIF